MPRTASSGPRSRRHLFEFEDFGWFPALFRNTITDWLRDAFVGAYSPVVPLVVRLLEHAGSDRVVDLCSGGSGPWEYLKGQVDDARTGRGYGPTSLTLTDRYPNVPAFKAATARIGAKADFRSEPVDAREVPAELSGVRTLFTSFHHLDPQAARAVLADAAGAGQAIGVFEFSRRDWANVRDTFRFLPMSMWRTVHTWRPRNVPRLFFTYVAPLIVLTSLWDAIASDLRSYRPDELEELARGLGGDGYRWEAGEVSAPDSTILITYLIGHPVTNPG